MSNDANISQRYAAPGHGEIARNSQISCGVSRSHTIVVAGIGDEIGQRDLVIGDEPGIEWCSQTIGCGWAKLYLRIGILISQPCDGDRRISDH